MVCRLACDRGEVLNLSDLAKSRNVPYSTVRKYVNALSEKGFISPETTPHSVTLHKKDIEVFDKLLVLIRSGVSFKKALDKLGEGEDGSRDNVVDYLQRLERKVDSLEEENKKLRELVQVYLSKVDELQNQLMSPKKRSWIFRIFKSKKEKSKTR
jgi:DNA-binding MarR family transcriptional regulator